MLSWQVSGGTWWGGQVWQRRSSCPAACWEAGRGWGHTGSGYRCDRAETWPGLNHHCVAARTPSSKHLMGQTNQRNKPSHIEHGAAFIEANLLLNPSFRSLIFSCGFRSSFCSWFCNSDTKASSSSITTIVHDSDLKRSFGSTDCSKNLKYGTYWNKNDLWLAHNKHLNTKAKQWTFWAVVYFHERSFSDSLLTRSGQKYFLIFAETLLWSKYIFKLWLYQKVFLCCCCTLCMVTILFSLIRIHYFYSWNYSSKQQPILKSILMITGSFLLVLLQIMTFLWLFPLST